MIVYFEKKLVAVSLLLTAVIFIGHYFLPDKRLQLHPREASMPRMYGFVDAKTGNSASWVDETTNEWLCDFKPGQEFGCGWEVYWDPQFARGMDFTAYKTVEISLAYTGPAKRIRLYMRNFNPAYASFNDSPSTKFLSMTFPVEEAVAPVRVALDEFNVAAWWLQEYKVRRRWARPELDNITKIGVDFVEPGLHRTRVDQIVLIGKWVRTETLLLVILGFWMTVFLLDGLARFYLLLKKSQDERHLIRTLEEKQRNLENDRKVLRELADTDPLTGVYNRTGAEAQLKKWFGARGATEPVGIMVLDLDHFKVVNDTYGHDMGDRVLRAFATLLAANLRIEDIFARWGGEEFVVACKTNSKESLYQLANKLREIASQQTFGAELELKVTVSIGVAIAFTGETFDDVFKRADKALYRAKQAGRNRVEVGEI